MAENPTYGRIADLVNQSSAKGTPVEPEVEGIPPIYPDKVQPGSAIYQQILNPVFSNLPYLEVLAKQASILTAASSGDVYGTTTASSRNPKPFIVGFIVPDIPLKYLPISQVKTAVPGYSPSTTKASSKKTPGGAGVAGPGKPYASDGTPGLQDKRSTNFPKAELLKEIEDAYTAYTGSPPSEFTKVMIFSQFCLENGTPPGSKTYYCYNYNLGNYHAGGSEVQLGNTQPSKSGPYPAPDRAPKGGSYFLTWDSRADKNEKGKNAYYSCYMKNYGSLKDGTRSQVFELLNKWPGVATASSTAEYNDALLPRRKDKNSPIGDFHETPSAEYIRRLNIQYDGYYKYTANQDAPPPGITASESSEEPQPEDQTASNLVMNNGDICGADVDPLQTSFGRNIRVDDERKKTTDRYVESIRSDIETVRRTPPLLMMINPETFDRSYTPSVDASAKGRQGHIVHMWMEKPLSISCKGVTAGQYVFNAEGSGGLSNFNRIQSISYQNLLSLIMMFKNNGTIYDGYSVGSGSLGVPVLQMSLYIYYDGKIYIGSFDDFSVEDSADKPHNLSYSYRFNVRYEIEVSTANVTDRAILGL